MNGRRFATGANAVLVAVLVLVILGVLGELARRHPLRADLSADALATLDPDTVAVLDLATTRGAAVTVTAFSAQAKDQEAWVRDRMMRDFLATLDRSAAPIETRFVDFDRDRLTAERLGVDRYGTVVVEARGDRVDLSDRDVFHARGPKGKRDVTFVGEGAISAAIRQVLSDRTETLYVLGGHGEREVYDRGLGELKELADRIDEQGFAVRGLDLLRDAEPGALPVIPPDAGALLILGLDVPLSGVEDEVLRAWLGRGGSVGLFLDPGDPVPAFLADVGITMGSGVVLDAVSYFPNLDRPLLRYGTHPITEVLVANDVPTVVSVAAPLTVEPRDGVTAATLLRTSPQGWVERGDEQPPSYTSGVDGAGPATVGVALSVAAPHPWMNADAGARLVVIGDVELLRDELLDEAPGNATFVTNVLRWLVRTDQGFARVGRPAHLRRLELGDAQLAVVRWLLIGAMPLMAALGGLGVAFVRRSA